MKFGPIWAKRTSRKLAKRYLLVGEGPTDLGAFVDYELLGGAVRIFTLKSLCDQRGLPRAAVELAPRPLKAIRKHRHGYAGKVLAAMTEADIEGFDGLIFVMDRDRDTDRLSELRSGLQAAREAEIPIPTALGLCIETVEAWLLADPAAVAEVLEVPKDQIPPNPEKLDGKESSGQHPKDIIALLIEKSPKEDLDLGQVYGDIAESADLDTVAKACPKGFAAYQKELEGLL